MLGSREKTARNVGIGIAMTLVVVACFFRQRVILPEVAGESMFRSRTPEDREICTTNVKVYVAGGQVAYVAAARYDEGVSAEDLHGVVGRSGSRGHGGTTVPIVPPQIAVPTMPESDELGELLGADERAPFAGADFGASESSWGWLADDVRTAERAEDDAFSSRRERGRDRRVFRRDDSSGGRFRSSRDTDNGYYFQRQGRRFGD